MAGLALVRVASSSNLLWARSSNVGLAATKNAVGVLRDVVQFPIGEDGRRPDLAGPRIQAFLVNELAGLGVLATDEAVRVAGPIQMAIVINGRADVGTFHLPPEAMRSGDVAVAAKPDGERRVPAANGEHSVVVRNDAGADITVNSVGIPQRLAV